MRKRLIYQAPFRLGKTDCLIVVALIAIGVIIYSNSLSNSFVWDDEALVLGNADIKSLRNIPLYFTTRLFPDICGGNFYRPVQSLSYAVDYSVWRLDPFGYHLTNVIIHALNAVLAYLLLFMVTGRREISFMASLLFVVHPINTEAVDYVSGRADLLAAFFMYLSMLCFLLSSALRGEGAPRTWREAGLSAAVILFFVLALLAKEATVVLPLLVILCCLCLEKRREPTIREMRRTTGRSWTLCASLPVIAALYLSVRFAMRVSSGEPFSSNPYPFYFRFLTSFKVVLLYMRLLIIPFPLHMERVVPMETSFFAPGVLLPLLFVCCIGIAAVKAYRGSKTAFLGIAWFFIALLPYLNWVPLNAEMAEHWLYVPSLGFFILVALGADALRFVMPSRAVAAVFMAVVVCLSFLTVRRNLDWRDNETIYTQTARSSPGSPRAHYNLGNLYLERGEFHKAIEEFRLSIGIKPRDFRSHEGLGKALLGAGKLTGAIKELETAVSLQPSSAGAHNELGVACGLAGLNRRAVRELETAIDIDPESARAHNNLASVYTNMGKYRKALSECERALELNPGLVEANFNLGVIYYHLEQRKKAIARFEKVLELKPDFNRAVIWLERLKSTGIEK